RRITCEGENIADAADGPSAEKSGLETDNVLVARGQVRDSLDAASFEGAGGDERVHADASHSAGVDVDGVDFAGSHEFIDLLEDAIEGKALGRIDFGADGELTGFQ